MDYLASTVDYIVPTDFSDLLNTPTDLSGANREALSVALYTRAPLLTPESSLYGVPEKATLDALPHWVEVTGNIVESTTLYLEADAATPTRLFITDGADEVTLDVADPGNKILGGWDFTPQAGAPYNGQQVVAAAVFYLPGVTAFGDDAIALIIRRGMGSETVALAGSRIGVLDQSGGTLLYTSGGGEWLAGKVFLDTATPTWEPSQTAHLWMYPQRTNLIANPRFVLGS
jgi:hypothetical protein